MFETSSTINPEGLNKGNEDISKAKRQRQRYIDDIIERMKADAGYDNMTKAEKAQFMKKVHAMIAEQEREQEEARKAAGYYEMSA